MLKPGTRVARDDELGTVEVGGSDLSRLVVFDNGVREYVHVDHLVLSDEPAPNPYPAIPIPPGAGYGPEHVSDDPPDGGHHVIRDRTPMGRRPAWTPELIIARMQEWRERFGKSPAVSDWNPTLARRNKNAAAAALFDSEKPHWPGSKVVVKHFGAWSKALKAAGLEPNKVGRHTGTWFEPQPVETGVGWTDLDELPEAGPQEGWIDYPDGKGHPIEPDELDEVMARPSPPIEAAPRIAFRPEIVLSIDDWIEKGPTIEQAQSEAGRLSRNAELLRAYINLRRAWGKG